MACKGSAVRTRLAPQFNLPTLCINAIFSLVGLLSYLLIGCSSPPNYTNITKQNTPQIDIITKNVKPNLPVLYEELGQSLEQDYLSNWYALFDEELTNKLFNADAW